MLFNLSTAMQQDREFVNLIWYSIFFAFFLIDQLFAIKLDGAVFAFISPDIVKYFFHVDLISKCNIVTLFLMAFLSMAIVTTKSNMLLPDFS